MLKQAAQTILQRTLSVRAASCAGVEGILQQTNCSSQAGCNSLLASTQILQRFKATEAAPSSRKQKITGPPDLYVFLATKWQFDEVYNQQIAKRVLDMGADTWRVIDKGFLEAVGPRGVAEVMIPAASKVRRINTGIVHDYAVVYKVVVLAGLTALMLPPDILGRASAAVIVPLLLISLM